MCGPDATVLISTAGQVYASGNNEFNKLCLNRSGSILSRRRSTPLKAGVPTPLEYVSARASLEVLGVSSDSATEEAGTHPGTKAELALKKKLVELHG